MMEPTLADPATNGIKLMYLRATMVNYPTPANTVDVPFYVKVMDCAPVIDST